MKSEPWALQEKFTSADVLAKDSVAHGFGVRAWGLGFRA